MQVRSLDAYQYTGRGVQLKIVKIINPEYTVEKIVARMREAARQAHAPDLWVTMESENHPPARQAGFNGKVIIQPLSLQPDFTPAADDHYHVNDLLKYHGSVFLHNAYQAVLKRGPDEAGYDGFNEALQSGRLNKIDILARLRYSREGRAKHVRIRGLLAPAFLRKTYRVPLVGYVINVGVAVLRLPVMLKHQRQFEAQMLARQQTIVDQLNNMAGSLMDHANQVNERLAGELESIARRRVEIQEQIEALREDHANNYEVVRERVGDLTTYIEERLNDEAAERRQEVWSLGERLGKVTSEWQEGFSKLGERLAETSAQWQETLFVLKKRLTEATSKLHADLSEARSEFDARLKQLDELSTEQTANSAMLHARTDTLLERAESFSQQLHSLTRRAFEETARALQKSQQVGAELALQAGLVSNLLQQVEERLPDGPLKEEQMRSLVAEKAHLLDAFYASFDEQFRGSRDGIKERLRVYLPYLNAARAAEVGTILDVGCGRGEWLELLQEQGFDATGVDCNSVLIRQCRERNLAVVEDDLMSYLRKLPTESIGTVTGFHVVEHLPLDVLIDFLNEVLRVLRPGRPIIFETPNPRNVLVGSCNFYFDPTHRNPLPSEVLKFLVESRGFTEVEVLPLNPSDETPVSGDSELVSRFNKYFYGPMDYGLVAWKGGRP